MARRDNSAWSRKIYEKVVRNIMDNMSFENLLNYMNQEILALMYWDKERCSNINDFIITKLVSDTYKIKPYLLIVQKNWKSVFTILILNVHPRILANYFHISKILIHILFLEPLINKILLRY